MSFLASATRRLKNKKTVIRKAGYLDDSGKIKITKYWDVLFDQKVTRISFSRDNFYVWIGKEPVEVTAYISDEGYDVDLFFDIGKMKGHIFSDVEDNELTNSLFIDKKLMKKEK